MTAPLVEVAQNDCQGLCLNLSTDAFVTWEDHVWHKEGAHVYRGMVATPFRVQAFQFPLVLDDDGEVVEPHDTEDCGTTYAPNTSAQSLNPITGLIIHPSLTLEQNPAPLFTLTRLTATHTNTDWYQTNMMNDSYARPQWATNILQSVGRSLPRSMAYLPRKPFMADDSDPEEESDDDEEGEWGFDPYNGELNGDGTLTKQGEDAMSPVFTTRMRIWGLQASPGSGSMAVFVTEHDTIKPERSTFAGLRCKIIFGQGAPPKSPQNTGQVHAETHGKSKLSTEAQTWEWMYNNGDAPPGIDEAIYDIRSDELKSRLADIATSQSCSFCDASVLPDGTRSRCTNGHVFGTYNNKILHYLLLDADNDVPEMCAATGVPILEPGLSSTCGVCSSKCLRVDILAKMLEVHANREDILALISPTFCGRCGGKFDD